MAQEYEYVPFVREGVKWVYCISNDDSFHGPDPCVPIGLTYLTLEFKGDTIINGKTYKAMHKYSGKSINQENDTIPVYMREENKVVYGIVPDCKFYHDCRIGLWDNPDFYDLKLSGEEFVLYDFNDPVSFLDTELNWDEECDFGFAWLYTDTIAIGNHYSKRHKFQYETDFYIVEGIGYDGWSSYTLMLWFTTYLAAPVRSYQDADFYLNHVIEDGEIIYKGIRYQEPNPEPDEYEYVPFVREGVKWVYSIYDYQYRNLNNHPDNGDGYFYRTLELRGDTIINGKTYKAMHRCVDDELSEPSDVIPIYLREEDKKVYGIVPDGKFYGDAPIGDFEFGTQEYFDSIYSGKEFLLYDFQDPVAYWDSIYHHSYYYDENDYNLFGHLYTDTIAIGHHLAQRYGFELWGEFQVIEGIGLIGSNSYPLCFFMPISTGIHDTEYFYLENVIENGDVIYGSVRDRYMPLILEGVKWVNEQVTVNNGDTTCNYYTYEFKGNHPVKSNYGRTYKALYRYDGRHHELDTANDSLVAGLREDWRDITYLINEPLDKVISQGRNMIDFDQGFLYELLSSDNGWGSCKDNYIMYQNEPFLNNDNFFEIDPIIIDGYRCRRLAYIGEQGDTLAYIVQGIGFDSYDMGDLLTPFTRKPDPNAAHQEWSGLSHVVKNGEIVYKGMRYRHGAFDGVNDVVADKTRRPYDPQYYNLMGQPVGKDVPTAPGIYIHNGKKIVVR